MKFETKNELSLKTSNLQGFCLRGIAIDFGVTVTVRTSRQAGGKITFAYTRCCRAKRGRKITFAHRKRCGAKRGQKNTYAHRRYAPSKPKCVRGIPAKLDDGPIMVEMVELSRKSITKREKKVRQLSLVQACAQKSPCQPTCS